jgi:FeS assembly SUF system protein
MRNLRQEGTKVQKLLPKTPKKSLKLKKKERDFGPFFYELKSFKSGFMDMTEEELKEDIKKTIKTIYDPEIPVDIFELGLIYEIEVYPVNNVYIKMTLTSPNCPAAGSLPEEVRSKVAAMDGINDVQLELTFDPPYSQDMMSEAAKLELGFL